MPVRTGRCALPELYAASSCGFFCGHSLAVFMMLDDAKTILETRGGTTGSILFVLAICIT